MKDLKTRHFGTPESQGGVPAAEDTFAAMEFEDMWPEADLVSVCHYVRAGSNLHIPESFRRVLPQIL